MKSQENHHTGIGYHPPDIGEELTHKKVKIMHFLSVDNSHNTGSETELHKVNNHEDQQNDSGNDHGPGSRSLTAGVPLALVDRIPLATRLAFAQGNRDSYMRMEKNDNRQSDLHGIQQNSQAVQLGSVSVERSRICQQQLQITDQVGDDEENKENAGNTGEDLPPNLGGQGVEEGCMWVHAEGAALAATEDKKDVGRR